MKKVFTVMIVVVILFVGVVPVLADDSWKIVSERVSEAKMRTELALAVVNARELAQKSYILSKQNKLSEVEARGALANLYFIKECEKCLDNFSKRCYEPLAQIIKKMPYYQGER
jgi:hypothetical protein